jgi:hypothetical protein
MIMIEQVMDTSSLKGYLETRIRSEKVRVRELNRIVTIEPVDGKEYNCPLLGSAAGSKLTVEKFLEMTREDGELECR